MKLLKLILLVGLFAGCVKPLPPKTTPCKVMELLSNAEIARLQTKVPDATGKVEFCRVVPNAEQNGGYAIVSIHRKINGVKVEDGLIAFFLKTAANEWVLLEAKPLYISVPLETQPAQVDAGVPVKP